MRIVRIGSFALARFLLSAVFLASAVNKIIHWHEAERVLSASLGDWQTYGVLSENFQNIFMSLALWTPALLIVSTTFELLGGLLLLLGLKERVGASLLIFFLIPATILMHPFWLLEGAEPEIATAMFLKNLAILGGLILVILNGAQSRSSSSGYIPGSGGR